MVFGWLAARSSERWSLHGTLVVGLALCAAGALGLLLGGLVSVPVSVVIVSLFLLVGGVAVTTPPTTTIALADHPRMAGTASSLLGMARFALGGAVAPLVGIAGPATMLPLGIVAVVAIALAAASVALLGTRRDVAREPDPTQYDPAAALAAATHR
jgi:DHA1 family bicyclomycin/chloramphenicol resistance-like MFS transporter